MVTPPKFDVKSADRRLHCTDTVLIMEGGASIVKILGMAILVNEGSCFANSCIQTQDLGDFGVEKAKFWQM